MSKGRWAAEDDAALVKSMFGAVGKIHEVEEKLLDAVTGLRYVIGAMFGAQLNADQAVELYT